MKKKNVFLTILAFAFTLSSSIALATGKISNYKPSLATETEVGWAQYYDVDSKGEVEFTDNKTSFLYQNKKGLGVNFITDVTLTYKQKVNVKALTKDFNIFEFYVDTQTKDVNKENAQVEFTDVDLRIENWNNPEEYIIIHSNNSVHDSELAWVTARTHGMGLAGMNEGKMSTTVRRGTPVLASYSGRRSDSISMRYDYKLNTVLINETMRNEENWGGINNMIRTLDNPTNVFANEEMFYGFSSEYVRIKVTFSGVVDPAIGGNVLITNVLGQSYYNENSNQAKDTVKPIFFYGDEFDINNIPVGEVNTKYPIWDITSYDATDGDVTNEILYEVYYLGEDGSQSRGSAEIRKKALAEFTPSKIGYYEIDVSVIDTAGNKQKITIPLKVVNAIEVLAIHFDGEIPSNVQLGSSLTLPNYTITGGSGIIKDNLSVKDSKGQDVVVANGRFSLLQNGYYTLTYTASDYLGNEFKVIKEINCEVSDKPVIGDVVVPSYYKKAVGEVIYLNKPTAKDYYSFAGQIVEVPVTVWVAENDGEYKEVKEINGKYPYVITQTANTLNVQYRATAMVDKTKTSYSTPKKIQFVTIQMNEESLRRVEHLYQYFYQKGGITSQYEANPGQENNQYAIKEAYYNVTEKGASLEYINDLRAGGFKIGFNTVPGKANFKKIRVVLQDAVSVDQTYTLVFTPSKFDPEKVTISSLNGEQVDIKGLLTNNSGALSTFKIGILNKNTFIDVENTSILFKATKFDNGEEFNGFSSNRVYVKIIFDDLDETKENKFKITNFFTTNFFYFGVGDTRGPIIETDKYISSYSKIMEKVVIPTARSYDDFSLNCKTYVSVINPNGEYVVGSETAPVPADVEYEILLDVQGQYKIKYETQDGGGVKNNIPYVINTIDTVAPTIEIDGQIKSTFKVGQTLTIPVSKAVDNVTASEKLYYYVYLKTPGYGFKTISANNTAQTYVFKQAGTYELTFFAMDDSGNHAERKFTINVIK